jgi:low affinity Fe/Cu permease
MDWAWRFGMIVFSGVPAIIGGGITFGFTESWAAVIAWEVVVVLCLASALIKEAKSAASPALAHEIH